MSVFINLSTEVHKTLCLNVCLHQRFYRSLCLNGSLHQCVYRSRPWLSALPCLQKYTMGLCISVSIEVDSGSLHQRVYRSRKWLSALACLQKSVFKWVSALTCLQKQTMALCINVSTEVDDGCLHQPVYRSRRWLSALACLQKLSLIHI